MSLPEGALPVFDVNGLKVIGRVVKDDGRKIYLEWAGSLMFGADPSYTAEGEPTGKLTIKATIQPIIPATRIYILRDAAIRGEFYMTESWLKELYAEYTTNCEKGMYGLNPFVKPVACVVQVGDGDPESPEHSTGQELDAAIPPASSDVP